MLVCYTISSMSKPRAIEERRSVERRPSRVVILGGGYGGVYTALGLQKAARRGQIELSLISRDNFFQCQPMLGEVVSGSIEPPHIVSSIRRLLSHTSFYHADIQAIDVINRRVVINYHDSDNHRTLSYDHLVIAVGGSVEETILPGVSEHTFPFKTLGDALFLRNHVIGVLEMAETEEDPEKKRRLLTVVVAGGGYTGVEVAAEINDFVREAVHSYPMVKTENIRVILLQGYERILPELSEDLAAFSHRLLERRGVEIRLNAWSQGATAEGAVLGDGEEIACGTLVSAIGAAPNRLLDSLQCSRDRRGKVVVDETLAVPGYPGLWAVGDCAAIPDTRRGGTCPPTAQYAVREAKHLARNILNTINGAKPKSFSHRSLGGFVPLGRFSAAAEVLGLKISGFLAWWLYRTYYLYQLPRLKRKLQVVIDWTLALFFRRDIVHLDINRSETTSRAQYEPGQTIFRQEDPARSFYIIGEGKVEVSRSRGDREYTVATLGPGEYFWEMALLQGRRQTASARALTHVHVLVMNGADCYGFGHLFNSVQ